jgi:hypothetical protein
MELEFFRQVLEKSSIIKCHANPSSGKRVISCGQTEERTERHDKANNCFVRTRLQTGEEREAISEVLKISNIHTADSNKITVNLFL